MPRVGGTPSPDAVVLIGVEERETIVFNVIDKRRLIFRGVFALREFFHDVRRAAHVAAVVGHAHDGEVEKPRGVGRPAACGSLGEADDFVGRLLAVVYVVAAAAEVGIGGEIAERLAAQHVAAVGRDGREAALPLVEVCRVLGGQSRRGEYGVGSQIPQHFLFKQNVGARGGYAHGVLAVGGDGIHHAAVVPVGDGQLRPCARGLTSAPPHGRQTAETADHDVAVVRHIVGTAVEAFALFVTFGQQQLRAAIHAQEARVFKDQRVGRIGGRSHGPKSVVRHAGENAAVVEGIAMHHGLIRLRRCLHRRREHQAQP